MQENDTSCKLGCELYRTFSGLIEAITLTSNRLLDYILIQLCEISNP